MIASLAKFIDWSVLQVAYAIALRAAPESKWKLEEALEFLNGPDFTPAASDPAQIAKSTAGGGDPIRQRRNAISRPISPFQL
jgi:hypothetical protein